MWAWTNDPVNGNYGYLYSRFIASWTNECTKMGKPVRFGEEFKDWLRTIPISEEDIHNIRVMAINGKFELESSIRKYFKQGS